MLKQSAFLRVGRLAAADVLLWTAVALAFAFQGQVVSAYRGTPQPWWPSLGYSLAIFSVWAILCPLVAIAVQRIEARLPRGWQLAVILAAGLPIVAGLHVAIFAFLYWPLYNGDGAIASRWAMTERMALANLDTNALLYAMVVGAALAWTARSRRAAATELESAAPATPALDPIRLPVRSKGMLRLISAAEIDWISAADDYAEIHVAGAVHLTATSLAALEQQLPSTEFVRIHRCALVRLDRVIEVRSLGRGDAMIRLVDGSELRLSRRYRGNLSAVLPSFAFASPAHPVAGSRPPMEGGTGA